MWKENEIQPLPAENGRYTCLLDNGDIITTDYVRLPNLGLGYFKDVVNTGRFVVSWEPAA